MKSDITRAIAFKHEPVAVVLTNQKPDNARQFKMEDTVKHFFQSEALDHFMHGERYIKSPNTD